MSGRGNYRAARKDQKYKNVRNFWGDSAKAKTYREKFEKEGLPGMEPLKADRPCRLCGRMVALVPRYDGVIVALDVKATVYCVVHENGRGFRAIQSGLAYADHKATCPEWREKTHAPSEPMDRADVRVGG